MAVATKVRRFGSEMPRSPRRPFLAWFVIATAAAAVALVAVPSSVAFIGIRPPQHRPVAEVSLTAEVSAEIGEAEVIDAPNTSISDQGGVLDDWAQHFPGVRPDLIPEAPVQDPAFVDEEALRKEQTFPIPEEGLVQLTKAFLTKLFVDPTEAQRRMASDFRFIAPVVPAFGNGISGEELGDALRQFNILEAVPDLNPQQYDFRTDPFEPNRVWFTARGRGTNTGPVFGALPATGKSYEAPPQSQSLTFNERGEVTKMTIGYVMDKTVGTTGGLGGIFGILYGIGYGLPIPEAQPWKPSPIYRLLSKTGTLLSSARKMAR
jgi:hypothetical protein